MQTFGNSAPADNELEISIFGPGRGESILVHLGEGKWIVVDSCINSADGTVPALKYLERIGVDVTTAVQLVVATHAHDDHIAGIARVVEACPSASFVCSSALSREEFYALVAQDAEIEKQVRRSSYREYRRIFEIADQRKRTTSGGPALKRAVEDLDLLRTQVGRGIDARVLALSPSHQSVTRSLAAFASEAASSGGAKRIVRVDPNELAVALWIEVGRRSMLLGADLVNGPAHCGWQGVLEWFAPDTKAEVLKVPHHGSPNAHWAPIWNDLLIPQPLALLTPFRAGSTPRPAPADIARLRQLAPKVYITASPRRVPAPRSVRNTAALINQLGRNVRDPWGASGQVCARSAIDSGDWMIQTYSPAQMLT